MAYQVYPNYAPPVDSTKIRQMWDRGIGVFGRLSGFQVEEDPLAGTLVMSKGSFISNSCVVNVDEMDLNIGGIITQPIFVYGWYDPKISTASVAVSDSPMKEWALIAYKWGDEWQVPDDRTTYSLWVNSGVHIDSDSSTEEGQIHITPEEKAAILAEPDAGPNNPFLTLSDTTVGMIYSDSDLSVAVMGVGAKGESGIAIDYFDQNMMSDCSSSRFASGGATGSGGGYEGAISCVEADGRWFEDTFREELSTWGAYHNLSDLEESVPSPISDGSRLLSIGEGGVEAVVSTGLLEEWPGESVLGSKVATFMIFLEGEAEYIKLGTHQSGGDSVYSEVKAPESGRWISMSVNIDPETSKTLVGIYAAIKGCTGCTFRVSPVYRSPVVSFVTRLRGPSENSKSFRVSPLTSSIDDRYPFRYYIESDGRDPFEVAPYFNHSPIESSAYDEYYRVKVVMRSAGGLVVENGTEWPDNRIDYCISDSSVTGSSLVIGGREGGSIKSSVVAYSPSGNVMTTIFDNQHIKANKACSSDFPGEILVCGGEIISPEKAVKMLDIASGTIQQRSDMPAAKKEAGSCSVDVNTSLVWGGPDNNDVYSYNKKSDTWTTMPSIVNTSGIRDGSYFQGATYHFRDLKYQVDIDDGLAVDEHESLGCIVIGSGITPGATGSKIDMATFTFVSLGLQNMVSGSNVSSLPFGVSVFQSEGDTGKRSGCLDILSGTERNIEVPTTGIGSSGNSIHSDGRISYGPFQGLTEYDRSHSIYSYIKPCWLNGIALKWEDDNS